MSPVAKRRKSAPFTDSSLLTPHPSFAIGVDLGSNTLRAIKRDCDSGAFVAAYEKIVRTADGLAQSGRVSEAAQMRIVEAIGEAKQALGFEDARIRAVTTEAMRRAANRLEALERIERETGIRFEVIDGEEEAALSLLAVQARLEALGEDSDSFVLVDIGGGSTELIFRYPHKVVSRSFPLGIVTLSQEAGSWQRVGEVLRRKLPPLERFVKELVDTRGPVGRFVATAGTPTTVAAMKLGMNYESYDSTRINGTKLQMSELRFHLQRLLAMDPDERRRAVGVGRDDLIAAGILIFEALYGLLGFAECTVIDDGLREGVVISLCERSAGR